MREEFEQQSDAWENSVAVHEILEKLQATILDNR
jgi:hypothetical protein